MQELFARLAVLILLLCACSSKISVEAYDRIYHHAIEDLGTVWSIESNNALGVVAIASDGDAYLINMQTDARTSIVEGMGVIFNLTWCDNFLVGGGKQIWVWNKIDNSITVNSSVWMDFHYYYPVELANNCQYAVSVYRTLNPDIRPLIIWDIAQESEQANLGDISPSSLSLNPLDSHIIAISVDNSSEVILFNLEEKQIIERFSSSDDNTIALSWSPSGTHIASATPNSIFIWNTLSWERSELNFGNEDKSMSLKWHPRGTHIASAGGSEVRIWNIASGEYTMVQSEGSNSIAWSENGATLFTVLDNELIEWRIDKLP